MSIKPVTLAVICLLILCAACAGAHHRRAATGGVPRADPGYLQWLQKQSMLAAVPDLVGQVSQTERVWLNSSRGIRPGVLLDAAPTWIELNPFAMKSGNSSQFRFWRDRLPSLVAAAVDGLYLGQTVEKADIWLAAGGEKHAVADENAAVSLEFAADFGTASEFASLAEKAEAAGMQIGSDLVPAATGAGPDFFLQARHAPGYTGLYAMLEAPKDIWQQLPTGKNEWDFQDVPAGVLVNLAERGLLPSAMMRDNFPWTPASGWAVTGEVLGNDGNPRRWLFRYDSSLSRPVMLWQDPSGLARQVFSAAIIQATGIQGQTLVGLRMQSLVGLEPATMGTDAIQDVQTAHDEFFPGLAAINSLSAQIHRYGGWALQADPLPPALMSTVLEGACDFCRDEPTSLLMAHGLLTADARPLANLYRQWLANNLDQTRLARGFNSWRWDSRILKAEPETSALVAVLNGVGSGGEFGIQDMQEVLRARGLKKDFQDFFLSFQLGLPGLVFIDAPTFLEAMNPQSSHSSGTPGTGPGQLLANRKKWHQASGILAAVEDNQQCLALFYRLPSGNYWLLGANFGAEDVTWRLKLPQSAKNCSDMFTDGNLEAGLDATGRKFLLALDGHQVRNVLFIVN